MTPRRTDASGDEAKRDPRAELAQARAEEARAESHADADTGDDAPQGPREGASIPEIELDIARTREEFAATLDAIEDKLSVPAHARRLKSSVKRRLDSDPKPVIAAAAAGTVGVVAVVAGIIKTIRR